MLTIHSFPLKKTACVLKKLLKDIVQVTQTSTEGRHSIDKEMNAESLNMVTTHRPTQSLLYNFLKLDARILAFSTEL